MHWIISVVGLVILGVLATGVRKRPHPVSYRDVLLEDELLAHIASLATQGTHGGLKRILIPPHMQKTLLRCIGELNRCPAEELLPAAQWLSDNGRFLQEMTASVQLELRHAPALPCDSTGEVRVLRFARELTGHTNADLRTETVKNAVDAWQKREPFTIRELSALPLVLKAALLTVLHEMVLLSTRDQHEYNAATDLVRLLGQRHENHAMRLFERYKHSTVFLEHLIALLRAQEQPSAVRWLDAYLRRAEHETSQMAQREHDRQTENRLWARNAITSLRAVSRMPWHRLCENFSFCHSEMLRDEAYRQMDEESRAYYRARIVRLSRLFEREESAVCMAALSLCESAQAGTLENHVGYYLLDAGLPALMDLLGTTVLRPRLWRFAKTHACGLYRVACWFVFALGIALGWLCGVTPWLVILTGVLLLIPFQQLTARICHRLCTPKLVPRLLLKELAPEQQTLVVCPTLLCDREHALKMVKHLSVLHQANPDPHLHFLLLGDPRDSLTATLSTDDEIVQTAAAAVQALCDDTGHPFFYMQRERMYNPQDHQYISRERKRGGLESLLRILDGRPIEDTYSYASCAREELQGMYRYVITLDSDTILPPGTALRMIGAMLHPLQRRQEHHGHMRGISILQPRMENAAHTVSSHLSLLLGGRGGTDPYNALSSDLMQDACGRGSYVGKGILDPRGFLQGIEGKIIPRSVLSHDLLEGELCGCAVATDIMLYDGQPGTLKGFLMRLHRWTRGDWQLLPYVLPVFPARSRAPTGCLDATAKHKIWQNLLRSVMPLCRLLLMLYALLSAKAWLFWLALLLPEIVPLFPITRLSLATAACRLWMFPCEVAMQADAIARTLYRLFVSRRNLLQWTTAAQLSKPTDKPPMLFFYICLGVGGAFAGLSFLPSALMISGLLVGGAWAVFPVFVPLLEQGYRQPQPMTTYMREELQKLAVETWLFFDTVVTEGEHFLPPDNVQLEPNKGVSHRTSPTNIGLYLCSLLAAQRMGFLTAGEMARRMTDTLTVLESLPKWEGHLYNWYDTRTLRPLKPNFVSSVDGGNLAVCLLCCAQGIRTLIPELTPAERELSARLDALYHAMRFDALYDPDAELFFIGVDPEKPRESLSHYDLLASEARLLSFVSIMSGQIPVRHWYRLGRGLTRTKSGETLVSYSGTMFEYMLPLLFQPPMKGTLLHRACLQALREQQRTRKLGVFGVSESGYYAFDPALYYQYRAFGIPSLALDPTNCHDVLAPYASLIALPLDTKGVFRNLKKMQSLGWEGALGLFEAADFSKERIGNDRECRIVRSHMAHHQGMILCAICNAVCGDYIAKLFTELPRAQAHALLLEEKPWHSRDALRHPLKRTRTEQAFAPLHAKRQAYPLSFPMDAHLLHGAGTTVLIDAQGGGFMSREGVFATRFREPCHLPSGMRVYLRDSNSGTHWFSTDPMAEGVTEFETAQAIFTREKLDVRSVLRIFVNPLDGTMLHHLTLENLTPHDRLMEVCSYLEPTLAPQRDDAAHPAFQNLFLETSRVGKYGVMALRRPRTPDQPVRRLVHTLSTDTALMVFHAQTDRSMFLGRGHTLHMPRALELPISAMADSVGAMIEPCLSLRAQCTLPANGRAQFLFATLLTTAQETPAAVCERYAQPESAMKAYELALTQGLVTARYLGLDAPMQNSLSRLCGAVGYTGQPHQQATSHPALLPLRKLWGLSISGDLPIITLLCEDARELPLLRLLLKAHAYFRLSGLWVDLVVVCQQAAGYAHPLRDAIEEVLQACHSRDLLGKDGGVHLVEEQGEELLQLLRGCSRLTLTSGKATLDDSLNSLLMSVKPPHLPKPRLEDKWNKQLPPIPGLLFHNAYGGFTPTEGDYVIDLPPGRTTPAPWCNMLASPLMGTLAGESGLIFTYAGNSHSGRLTRWPNDAVSPCGEENFYCKDEQNRLLWSVTRTPLNRHAHCRVIHAPGSTTYESYCHGLFHRLTCFVDPELPLSLRVLTLKNDTGEERSLKFFHTCALMMTNHPSEQLLTSTHREDGVIYGQNPTMEGVAGLCMLDPAPSVTTTMSSGRFYGLWGSVPTVLGMTGALPCDAGNVAVSRLDLTLRPDQSITITMALGFAQQREALDAALDVVRAEGASARLRLTRGFWAQQLDGLRFDVPDAALSLMLNRWLPYQVRAARLYARAGFYQAGGAIGFRDQLQDMLALVHTQPHTVREHLLVCAAHQFEQGDVQHWWHPPYYGVRTRISDDLLFLPFLTAIYVQITGDSSVLTVPVSYLKDEPLADEEHERLSEPSPSPLKEPLLAHCLRAIEHVRLGAHGLPLMGGGDWNDGMNRVGGENGESVWLGMFMCEVLRRFAPLCDEATVRVLGEKRHKLLHMLDRNAWDGSWYLRAWYDDGEPLGSSRSAECRIDALPQSWAVLSGVSRERSALAMDNLWRMLYEKDVGILKLFTPPFNGLEKPGYIAGYLPGIRENGGQYTHSVPWTIAALHQLGRDDLAWELCMAVLPINHALTRQLANRYRVEPYVMPGDVYSHPRQRGRGGWTWYTGSASWLYYTVLEQLFGFQKTGNTLRLRPSVPKGWEGLSITYRYGSATYHLHASVDCPFPVADGEQLHDGTLVLQDDGRIHDATFPIRSAELSE